MSTALVGTPDAASRDARTAADRAGVEVTEPAAADLQDVRALIAQVWGQRQQPQDNLVRAFADAGTGLLLARRGGECVGVSLGFLGWTEGVHLHSHMTAVRPGGEHRGVGFALKLRQRAVALDAGVGEVRWTYDPLIARNAHFNLVKLGAAVRRFLPDHYGQMDDEVNAGDVSDRFEISWQLDSRQVTDALRGARTAAEPDWPLVGVPEDYDRLRRQRPDDAREVRERTGAAFRCFADQGRRPVWAAAQHAYAYPPAAS